MSVKCVNNFFCELCNVKCRDNVTLKRHFATDKHKLKQNKAECVKKVYKCDCGKEYKLSGSFCNHKKSCKFLKKKEDDKTELLLLKLEEQKKDIQELKEVIKENPTNQYNTHNGNNITNNKFNLNIFLNEKCKDAINILEFQEQVLKAITDISDVLNITNTDSITNAFNITYNNLDDYEKPYYSLDKSRQQMIIKNDKNEWVKDKELICDIAKPIANQYTKNQLDNFYEKVIDKDNMNDKQEREFTEIIMNTTPDINNEKLCKNVIKNGLNPKSI
jgi:hypothetical protein